MIGQRRPEPVAPRVGKERQVLGPQLGSVFRDPQWLRVDSPQHFAVIDIGEQRRRGFMPQ